MTRVSVGKEASALTFGGVQLKIDATKNYWQIVGKRRCLLPKRLGGKAELRILSGKRIGETYDHKKVVFFRPERGKRAMAHIETGKGHTPA